MCFFISALGVTAGAHRLWSHRSYKASSPLRVFLAIANSMAFQVKLNWWHIPCVFPFMPFCAYCWSHLPPKKKKWNWDGFSHNSVSFQRHYVIGVICVYCFVTTWSLTSCNSHYLCLFVRRMTYMSGRGTTASTTSIPRQMQTPTMPCGGSSLPTSVGCWFASILMSLKKEKNWSCQTWRQIKWSCSKDGEQRLTLCFPLVLLLVLFSLSDWICLNIPRKISLEWTFSLQSYTSTLYT